MRRVQPQAMEVPISFKITQKVQLAYKLNLIDNARKVLNKELDKLADKAYEDVKDFLKSAFPTTSAFVDLSDTLDNTFHAIETLTAFLKKLKITSQVPSVDRNDAKTDFQKSVKEGNVFKFGSMLQNKFMTSSICKAVQVLGATLHYQHFKHLVIPQSSEIQEKGIVCSASISNNNIVQVTEILKDSAQVDVEKCSSHEAILPSAICDNGKTNTHKPLLPPIPAISPTTGCNRPFVGIPVMTWGHEDDMQVHQKQTSTQLLHFLKVKAQNTGALNVTVMEGGNRFLGVPEPPCPSHNITKQTYQFKQESANVTCPSGLLSDTEIHAPLFKLKRVDSSGFLTYTFVIATKTELWDMGDIVTDLDHSESSSLPRDENGQVMASEGTLQWLDATIQKDKSTKMPRVNVVIIPEFQNKRFEEMEVTVSHTVSPSSFYIQHADASEKLQTLSNTWKESSSYAEQSSIPDIGTKVMGWFPQQQQWCRSQVTKICGIQKDDINDSTEMSINLEVKRLDYGDSFCLSLSNIKELTFELAALPLQAVHVSLAHVSPVNGKDWSEEAVGWFRAMVHNRTLYARLYPEGDRVTAELFLEKGNIGAMRRGASLSLRLTQNGHSKHDKLKSGFRTVQLKTKKKDLELEKYLISCYTQSNLHWSVL